MRYLYSELATAVQARRNCKDSNNSEWLAKWEDKIRLLVDRMPSGSGIDCGTKLDLDASHAEKLVFHASYHHMHGESGMYDGWTEHTITVTPSFSGHVNIRISGCDRNAIKEYLHEEYYHALTHDVTYWILLERFPQFAIEHKWEGEDGQPSQCYQAFYVKGIRFWNNWSKAIEYASGCMEQAEQNAIDQRNSQGGN